MIKNAAFDDIRKELKEVKNQRDDLSRKNIALEKEKAKLIEIIGKLKATIIILCDEIEEDI